MSPSSQDTNPNIKTTGISEHEADLHFDANTLCGFSSKMAKMLDKISSLAPVHDSLKSANTNNHNVTAAATTTSITTATSTTFGGMFKDGPQMPPPNCYLNSNGSMPSDFIISSIAMGGVANNNEMNQPHKIDENGRKNSTEAKNLPPHAFVHANGDRVDFYKNQQPNRQPHPGFFSFESAPAVRKKHATRIIRKIEQLIEELTLRVGVQAGFVCLDLHNLLPPNYNYGDVEESQGPLFYRVIGSHPLHSVLQSNSENMITQTDMLVKRALEISSQQQKANNEYVMLNNEMKINFGMNVVDVNGNGKNEEENGLSQMMVKNLSTNDIPTFIDQDKVGSSMISNDSMLNNEVVVVNVNNLNGGGGKCKNFVEGGDLLPPLIVDGVATTLDKMTQAQLRAFIPAMLRYSTNRNKPSWGKPETKPLWWPDDVPWANVRSDVRSNQQKMLNPWTSALKKIVQNCYEFHGKAHYLTDPPINYITPANFVYSSDSPLCKSYLDLKQRKRSQKDILFGKNSLGSNAAAATNEEQIVSNNDNIKEKIRAFQTALIGNSMLGGGCEMVKEKEYTDNNGI